MARGRVPSFREEKKFVAGGYRLVAGIDEVGCGALAGPLVAAAVILSTNLKTTWLKEVRDSKELTPAKREILAVSIREVAISFGIGEASKDYIDTAGLTLARRLAMQQAIASLLPQPQALLIDYFRLPEVTLPQKGIVHGDGLCFSIACASIIAKVYRDRLMVGLDAAYPGYGFAQHKGYGTAAHLECLHRLGPSAIHRSYYQPVLDAALEE
jgi:ribonuclease HII